MSEVDWSAIPRDVLELISRSFAQSDIDYVRFRSVCTTWRSAARPELPWLIGRFRDVRGGYPIIFFKLSLSSSSPQQQVHCQIRPILDLSKSPPCIFFHRKRIIGWSHGWMILMDPTTPSNIFIWNPITGYTIHLPSLPSCTAGADADSGSSFVFFKFFEFILSSCPAAKDGVMLTVCYRHKVLSFCRAREGRAWTRLDCHKELPGGWFLDWAHQSFFHRGRFFMAANGDVCVYGIGGLGNILRSRKIASLDCKRLCSIKVDKYHFVESEGDLLLVLASRARGGPNTGYSFVVLKIEWRKKAKLVKLASLGDRALFVCWKDSFSVSATEFPGCNANSIYYINEVHGETEIRMYSLQDMSDVLVADGAALPRGFGQPCSWFTPSL